MRPASIATAVLALAGCGLHASRLAGIDAGSDAAEAGGGDDAGVPSIPMSEYCERYAEAQCEGLELCACGPVDLDNCRTAVWLFCPTPTEAVAEGRIEYDGEAAARYVASLRARNASCEERPIAAEWPYSGTLPPGAACSPESFLDPVGACEDGVCVPVDGGSCRRAVGEGEVCGTADVCIGDPYDLLRVAWGSSQTPSLRCEMEGPAAGTCVPAWKLEGATCEEWDECRSRRCLDGVCEAPAAIGEACGGNLDCGAGGLCAEGSCTAQSEVGAYCTDAAECLSGSCREGLCRPEICRHVASVSAR